MYSSYYNYPINSSGNYNDDRIIAGGGLIAPFLLGGLTGALLAPRPYPYYPYPYYPYQPYYYRRFPRYYY